MAAVPRHYCPARKPDYVQAFKQAPPIWHRRLAATDGLEGIASVLASLVEHHQKSHHLGWLPCHYSTTWHTQWCPGFHRHHHPATETGHSRCGTTHPCRLVTCSDTPPPAAATRWACRELAVSHWHTTKHGLVPFTQLPPSPCMRRPPSAKRAKCGLPADGTLLAHTMYHVQRESNTLRWNMVIEKKKKEEKAEGCPLLGRTWNTVQGLHKAPSFEHFRTNLYTQPVSTPLHLQNLNKKKKKNIPKTRPMPPLQMQYLMSHYCVKQKKKSTKFDSHKGTKGSRHQYHSYWMGVI